MPTRNGIQFLPERLESIRQQTFGDWELIVVYSDSTDGTREMLDEFAAENARMRVYHASKDGIYPNFNRCLQLANGPFVYIATSDDIMASDCLEKCGCLAAKSRLRSGVFPDEGTRPDRRQWSGLVGRQFALCQELWQFVGGQAQADRSDRLDLMSLRRHHLHFRHLTAHQALSA